ncbi:MAG: hypothetical protein R2861_06370 [Desulfobacterales bacterium]
MAEALKNAKIVTVLDRSESMGAHGPLFCEIRTALFDAPEKPLVYSRTFGLGGRELFMSDIHDIFEENKRYLETGTVEKTADYLKVGEVDHAQFTGNGEKAPLPADTICAGCPVPIFTKMITRVTDGYEIVAGNATCCLSGVFHLSLFRMENSMDPHGL